MKKSKKFVLAGLVLVAITMVLLPLAGCKTEVDTSSPQQPGGKVIEYSGGTFTGLQEAVNALESGAILKLTADLTGVTESISIPAGADFTLDLKGHTISGTANPILKVQESAKLTITDSSSEKKGAITATGMHGAGVDNYGTLEVSGGTITGNDAGVYNYGTLEVSGGTITGNYAGVYNDGILEVSGGTITGNYAGVENGSGEGVAFYLSGSPTITGGLVLETPVTLVGALTGSGTYTVDTGSLGGHVVAVGGSASTGGAAYQITESDKDKFTVDSNALKLEGSKIIWEGVGQPQRAFQDKVGAMAAGGTLSLDADLTDVTNPISIPAGADFTLDLKGHTISGTAGSILEVQVSAKLTIIDSSSGKKGAITATGEGGDGVYNYGTLEVSGGTITATGDNGYGVYNYGTLEVSGGIITSGNYTGVYNDGTLEVSGGSITGGIYGVNNDGTLEVSGGSITGGIYGVNNYGTLEVSGGSITGGTYGVDNFGTLEVSGGTITPTYEYNYGVYNRSREGVVFYLSGSPTITGRLVLETPVTLVGALTGSGTYTVDTGSLGGHVVAVGGSASTGGAAYQITESDKDKFTVDSNALKLEGSKIIWEGVGQPQRAFQDKVGAMAAGGTLSLDADLTDVTNPISIPAGADFTLDLKGHTISGTADPILKVQESAKLTIIDSSSEKKGAITATGDYGYGVDNDGTLKVSGGTITSGNYIGVYNDGTLEVSGGTITGNYAGVYNGSEEGVAFYLSGSPTITGGLELWTPVTLVGALTGSGTYTVDTGSLGGYVVAVGGSATGGTAYQITESDKGKFTVATGTVTLEGNKIVWTEQATQ